jgi:hypothetical protein
MNRGVLHRPPVETSLGVCPTPFLFRTPTLIKLRKEAR